jgi:hypothetical protein
MRIGLMRFGDIFRKMDRMSSMPDTKEGDVVELHRGRLQDRAVPLVLDEGKTVSGARAISA